MSRHSPRQSTVVTFPDGTTSGTVTLLRIPGDRTPNCYGVGNRFPYLIALQPENTVLSRPAQLSMPNDLGLTDGKKVSFYSLNKDSGRFGISGVATVKGANLVTDPGSGLTTFDWHDIGPTPPDHQDDQPDRSDPCSQRKSVGSAIDTRSGELTDDVAATAAYRSLGAARGVGLHYSSTTAAPEILATTSLIYNGYSSLPAQVSLAASGSFGSGQSYYDGSKIARNTVDQFQATVKIDAKTANSGRQFVKVTATGHYPTPNPLEGGLTEAQFSYTSYTEAAIINGAQLYPALGKGWSIANVDRLIDHGDAPDPTKVLIAPDSVMEGGVDIVRGDGKIDTFHNPSTVDVVAQGNLGLELGATAGFAVRGNAGVVPNLGFVRAPEGAHLLLLRGDLASNTKGECFIPLTNLPDQSLTIEFEADMLTLDSATSGVRTLGGGVVSAELRYSHSRNTDYGNDADGGFADFDSSVNSSLYADLIQAGGDTGYASRSGFRHYRINVPAEALGKKAYLYFRAAPQPPYTYDGYSGYGGYSTPGFSTALLVDAIRFNYTYTSGQARRYAPTGHDSSRLAFLTASQTYERSYKDGSVQVFDAQGRQTESRDRLGNRTLYAYADATGRGQAFDLAAITDPVGLVTSLSYAGGKLSKIVDPAGRATGFAYDKNGGLTQIAYPDGSARGFAYDARGKLTAQIDALGNRHTYAYGASGRLAQVTEADGAVHSYLPQGGRGLDDAGVAGDSSNPAGTLVRENATAISDARGNVSKTQLNAMGQPLAATDALGRQTQSAYDYRGRPSSQSRTGGAIIYTNFDDLGNLRSVTNSFNYATASASYEPLYNLPAAVTDALGHTTTFGYDVMGNLTRVTDARGQVSTLTYNAAGQTLTAADALGHTTTLTYDGQGRVASAADALGRTTTFTYDAAGNVASVTDPAGRVTATRYDPMNRPLQVTAADGGVTAYAYDAGGALLSLTDPNGHVRARTYDRRRRPQTATDALGQTTTYSYDAAGNLASVQRPDGATLTYAYDALNRPVRKNLPALANGVAADALTFDYDALGNLAAIADADSAISNTFDPLSRLTATTQTLGGASGAQTLAFEYDAANRRTRLTDAAGATAYAYDELNRLTGLTDAAGRAFGFSFDAASRPTATSYPNGIGATASFSAADELLNLAHGSGSAPLASVAYAYNPTGTRTSEGREDGNTRSFGYDAADRVLSSVNSALPSARNEAFSYDEEGNRTDSARLHDAADELTEDATYTYAYDAEGNLVSRTSKSDPAKVTSYAYDAMNRLVQVQTAGGGTVTYAYDALGRRVAKNNNGVTTRYVLDGWNVRLELDGGTGSVLAANTHAGLDRLLVRDQAGTSLFLHPDGINSTTALTDAQGQVLERYRYAAFGKVEVLNPDGTTKAGNAPAQPFTFTGREWEPESGLFFYRNRFYSAQMGRFINRDPIEETGGINLYAYTDNNPSNLVDPLGWQGFYIPANQGEMQALSAQAQVNTINSSPYSQAVSQMSSVNYIIDAANSIYTNPGFRAASGANSAVSGVGNMIKGGLVTGAAGPSTGGLALTLGIGQIAYGNYQFQKGVFDLGMGLAGKGYEPLQLPFGITISGIHALADLKFTIPPSPFNPTSPFVSAPH